MNTLKTDKMNSLKKHLSGLFLLLSTFAFAQDTSVEMADVMRSNGKIYVVLAVVLIVFIGFILYLIHLDRKISKLEKEIEE